MPNFNVDDYIPVNERLQKFWEEHQGNGAILTELVHLDGPETKYRMAVMKALVFVDKELVATGFAKERESTAGANKTAFIENCETSAVGRALANYGMLIERGIASREEMRRVKEDEEELAQLLSEIKTAAIQGGEDAKARVNKAWKTLSTGSVLSARLFLDELRTTFDLEAGEDV